MRLTRGLIHAALIILIITAASACGSPSSRVLVITGSSTLAPVMSDLASAYEKSNPDQRIDVQSGGSSRGIRDVRQGLADAGMVSRSLTAEERDLTAHTLARDGVVLIVNSQNPVNVLDKQTIRDIYRGEIDHWAELGGPDRPITVINKAAGRATLAVFLDYFQLKPAAVTADIIAGENQQVIRGVAGDPAAIGYVSAGSAAFEADNGTAIRLLPMSGIPATAGHIRTGDYPLTRDLHVVTQGEPNADMRAFMDFWRTPQAARIIREHYFVPAAP